MIAQPQDFKYVLRIQGSGDRLYVHSGRDSADEGGGGMKKGLLGLVLSGGGAKGAYHVGVVRALAELGIEVDAISGASIGALNGAVAASSGTLRQAAERLLELWRIIAEKPPLGDEPPRILGVLEALGLEIDPGLRSGATLAHEVFHNLVPAMKSPETVPLADNRRIREMIDAYVTDEGLSRGTPLYVSVFPNRNYLESLLGAALARLGIRDNPKSEFLHIQSLPAEERRKALLASAAIPFLLESPQLGDMRYLDGGLGGVLTSQGNTPIEPLLDFGCDTVIVSSLSDRTAWSRQRYPNARIIGIERGDPIARTPILPEVFDIVSFDPDKIYSWSEQGYGEAMHSLRPSLDCLR